MKHHRLFQTLWYAVNGLLVVSLLLLIYSSIWEYSTRQYLKGFSDAIVPISASPEEKIQAILKWMERGPSRQSENPSDEPSHRDPEKTLNYGELLRVCGTATNAFVNLANSSGMPSRRLLLLDDNREVNHVVAEVLVDGRWIVVDPAFRFIPHGPHGELLTQQDLSNPTVFRAAVKDVPNYKSDYDYDMAIHVRMRRLPLIGRFIRPALSRLMPKWEDAVYWTLLLERESFAALNLALFSVLFFLVLRAILSWYGEGHLQIYRVHVREQLLRAMRVFVRGSA